MAANSRVYCGAVRVPISGSSVATHELAAAATAALAASMPPDELGVVIDFLVRSGEAANLTGASPSAIKEMCAKMLDFNGVFVSFSQGPGPQQVEARVYRSAGRGAPAPAAYPAASQGAYAASMYPQVGGAPVGASAVAAPAAGWPAQPGVAYASQPAGPAAYGYPASSAAMGQAAGPYGVAPMAAATGYPGHQAQPQQPALAMPAQQMPNVRLASFRLPFYPNDRNRCTTRIDEPFGAAGLNHMLHPYAGQLARSFIVGSLQEFTAEHFRFGPFLSQGQELGVVVAGGAWAYLAYILLAVVFPLSVVMFLALAGFFLVMLSRQQAHIRQATQARQQAAERFLAKVLQTGDISVRFQRQSVHPFAFEASVSWTDAHFAIPWDAYAAGYAQQQQGVAM